MRIRKKIKRRKKRKVGQIYKGVPAKVKTVGRVKKRKRRKRRIGQIIPAGGYRSPVASVGKVKRRKKHTIMTKTRRSRRRYSRRVGAIKLIPPQSVLMTVVGALAGAFVSKFVSTKFIPVTATPVNKGLIQIGGVLVGTMLAQQAQPLVKGLGIGLAADMGNRSLQSFGVLQGIGNIYTPLMPYKPRPVLNGVTSTPQIGAANPYGFPVAAQVGAASLSKSAQFGGGVYN